MTIAVAKKGDVGVYLEGLGTVTPVYTVTITARVLGQITNVAYCEGQRVKVGDLLIEIDPRPYQALLLQARGQLAHDRAVLAEARIDLIRYRKAVARHAIPRQQVDDQEQVVLQNEGTVKSDLGAVAAAKINVVYTRITSPIEGRVGLRLVDPGNIIQAGSTTPLLVVTQLEPITVIFNVSEDHLAQIQDQVRLGHVMPVQAFDRAWAAEIARGTLLTFDNQVDTTTGTIRLRAIFPNLDDHLFPNQFVNARLLVDTKHAVVLVPGAAIQRSPEGAFVYVISETATAVMRHITVGTADGAVTEVSGVSAGEAVVVSGFDKLRNGVKVEIKNPPPATSPPTASDGAH